jgi:hypothetical protein
MRNPFDIDHLRALPIGWWGAIAGAAVAGATLFPSARVLAGAAAAAGMLTLAVKLTPCCDGCAAGKGCGGSPTTETADPPTGGTVIARGDDTQAPFTDGEGGPDVLTLFDQASAARGCA